jgi:O-methyltransferase
MFHSAKQKFRKFVESSGYMVVKTQVSVPGHQRAYPYATYAPWLADKDFLDCYESVRSHTLVDKYRFWEIWEALKEAGKLDEGDCLEIGVWRDGGLDSQTNSSSESRFRSLLVGYLFGSSKGGGARSRV